MVWDVEEGVFGEVLEGASIKVVLSPILRDLANEYVLTNMKIMAPRIH
jgi:hypothetical protein